MNAIPPVACSSQFDAQLGFYKIVSTTVNVKPLQENMYRSAPISFDTRSRSAARSHAARVGWQRSSKAAKIQERQRMLKDFLPESAWEPRWNNQEAVNRQPNQTSTQRNINAGCINDAIRVIDVSLAYGKIFPSHGAISLPMLDETTDSTAFHVAQFLGTFIWPTVGGHIAAYQWFQDFCTSRVLFHSQSAASATYRDLMAGKPSISMTRRNFLHKLEAIREIRSSLTRWHMVSKPEREQVIFAILILASHEVKEKDFLETTSPFSAYFPVASHLNLWGRTDPIDAHDDAAFSLIEKEGGIEALESPGLAPMASFVDLLRACTYLRQPRFPCLWEPYVPDVTAFYLSTVDSTITGLSGSGFALLSRDLPREATMVFMEAAYLDQLFNHFRSNNMVDLNILFGMRNTTLHRLLSLEISTTEPDQPPTNRNLYNILRIACTIYCNAVMLAIPPHNGWLNTQSAALQKALKGFSLDICEDAHRNAYLWVLFVGGVASRGTFKHLFFKRLLQECVQKWNFSWRDFRNGLKTFIWTSIVCDSEARLLWN